MTNRNITKFLSSLITSKIQIKTIIGYHFTPMRMVNNKSNKFVEEYRDKGTFLQLIECKLG